MPAPPSLPVLDREWHLRPIPAEALAAVQRSPASARLPLLVQTVLAQRGFVEDDAIGRFLRPKLAHLTAPERLPSMPEAVVRLSHAIDQNHKVVLYGDYDVDGVTSLAILVRVLKALGLMARTFLPHRADEGYGLSQEGLQRCLAGGRPDLLVAVDCGTASVREIAWLREQAIDVIVLDHHEPSPEGLPDAIVVNPKLGPDFHYLCTAGLAFKMSHALLKARGATGHREVLEGVLDFVALGTVSDVVPLVGENRLLVAQGLARLATSRHAGLHALKEVAGVNGRPRAFHLGYRLGPRLNAAGRLDTAQTALDLLLTGNFSQAAALAHHLDGQNRERQAVQARVEDQAMQAAWAELAAGHDGALVLGSDSWHPGVVGIVAGKLARRFHRPALVVAFDDQGLGKGSGRSVEGISLVAAIDDCRETVVKGGGHAMAAGITVERSRFDAFKAKFLASIAAQVAGRGGFRPRAWADAEVFLADLDFELLDAYDQLEPFGEANPQPVLMIRGVSPAQAPKVLKEKHRRLEVHQHGTTLTAMWFDSASVPLPPAPWDLLVTIQRGEFRGEERVEVFVQDVRAAAS